MTAPSPAPATAAQGQACTALLARLPDTVDGHARRPTDQPGRVAAWGDPAITLLCASPPADLQQSPLILDGLAFTTERRGDRVLWTTRDRAVAVRLDIPLAYDSQADIVLPLVPALAALPAA